MLIKGTPSETGDAYTVAVTAKRRWVRKLVMWILLIRNEREILGRFESEDTLHVVQKFDC